MLNALKLLNLVFLLSEGLVFAGPLQYCCSITSSTTSTALHIATAAPTAAAVAASTNDRLTRRARRLAQGLFPSSTYPPLSHWQPLAREIHHPILPTTSCSCTGKGPCHVVVTTVSVTSVVYADVPPCQTQEHTIYTTSTVYNDSPKSNTRPTWTFPTMPIDQVPSTMTLTTTVYVDKPVTTPPLSHDPQPQTLPQPEHQPHPHPHPQPSPPQPPLQWIPEPAPIPPPVYPGIPSPPCPPGQHCNEEWNTWGRVGDRIEVTTWQTTENTTEYIPIRYTWKWDSQQAPYQQQQQPPVGHWEYDYNYYNPNNVSPIPPPPPPLSPLPLPAPLEYPPNQPIRAYPSAGYNPMTYNNPPPTRTDYYNPNLPHGLNQAHPPYSFNPPVPPLPQFPQMPQMPQSQPSQFIPPAPIAPPASTLAPPNYAGYPAGYPAAYPSRPPKPPGSYQPQPYQPTQLAAPHQAAPPVPSYPYPYYRNTLISKRNVQLKEKDIYEQKHFGVYIELTPHDDENGQGRQEFSALSMAHFQEQRTHHLPELNVQSDTKQRAKRHSMERYPPSDAADEETTFSQFQSWLKDEKKKKILAELVGEDLDVGSESQQYSKPYDANKFRNLQQLPAESLSCPKSDGAIYAGYKIFCNKEIHGYHIQSDTSRTFKLCIEQCHTHPDCLGVNYRPTGLYDVGECHLKAGYGPHQKRKGIWSAKIDIPPSPPLVNCPGDNFKRFIGGSGYVFEVRCGMEHHGGEMYNGIHQVDHQEECLAICESRQDCQSITYQDEKCYLHDWRASLHASPAAWTARIIQEAAKQEYFQAKDRYEVHGNYDAGGGYPNDAISSWLVKKKDGPVEERFTSRSRKAEFEAVPTADVIVISRAKELNGTMPIMSKRHSQTQRPGQRPCQSWLAPYPLGNFEGTCDPWDIDRCDYCHNCGCDAKEYMRCQQCWPPGSYAPPLSPPPVQQPPQSQPQHQQPQPQPQSPQSQAQYSHANHVHAHAQAPYLPPQAPPPNYLRQPSPPPPQPQPPPLPPQLPPPSPPSPVYQVQPQQPYNDYQYPQTPPYPPLQIPQYGPYPAHQPYPQYPQLQQPPLQQNQQMPFYQQPQQPQMQPGLPGVQMPQSGFSQVNGIPGLNGAWGGGNNNPQQPGVAQTPGVTVVQLQFKKRKARDIR